MSPEPHAWSRNDQLVLWEVGDGSYGVSSLASDNNNPPPPPYTLCLPLKEEIGWSASCFTYPETNVKRGALAIPEDQMANKEQIRNQRPGNATDLWT